MSSWINFQRLRESLSFEQIFQHYNVQLKIGNGKATGFCPLPSHRGERRSPSFSAQLEKRVFQCFGCGAKGNILDFACLMEGKNPRHGPDIHQVALDLQNRFLGEQDDRNDHRRPQTPQDQNRDRNPPPRTNRPTKVTATKPNLPVVINAPLDITLQDLDFEHLYLKNRGFSEQTVKQFGLGFCNRGTFKGRVVIPLHDPEGQFIGYAGRLVDDQLISPTCPKYRFPAPRERDGELHELHKSLFLYNGHRIERPVADLIVMEGFPSVWWLWQHGYKSTVALMGSDCSSEQAKLIIDLVGPDGKIWALTDGDDAGDRCGESLLSQLSSQRFVRWIPLAEGQQPTDCTPKDLRNLLAIGARKSGTSKKPRVASSRKSSNVKPSESMAAKQ